MLSEPPRSFQIRSRIRTVRLGDICAIQPGYARYRRLPRASAGEGVPAIRLRDLLVTGLADPDRLARYAWPGATTGRYFVRKGDVVFRPRGDRNTAAVLDRRFREHTLVLLPMLILRAEPAVVLPEFLAWTINQPPAQRHFDRVARGTNMRMVLRPGIENLRIEVPRREVQRMIVAVDRLSRRERALATRAADIRRQLVARTLVSAVTAAPRVQELPTP